MARSRKKPTPPEPVDVQDWGPVLRQPPEFDLPAPFLDAIAANERQRPVVRTRVQRGPFDVFYLPDVLWHFVGPTAIPAVFMAWVHHEGEPDLFLDLMVEEGRVVCNRVSVVRGRGAPPLKATQIRHAFDKLARDAASVVAVTVDEVDANGQFRGRRDGDGESVTEFLKEYETATKRMTKRGSPMPAKHLQEVARIYREALEARRPPTKAVQLAFADKRRPVSRSTAGRWVGEARKQGFLGTTQPRRAGDVRTKGENDNG